MCGIFGTVGFNKNLPKSLKSLEHRGPDDYGEFFDNESQVYLGHRRLSIIDLTRAGRQPMVTEDTSIYITYNGEVYNFQAIKEQYFKNVPFHSSTDTEVILHIYQKFGQRAPVYMRGMFAFGIYDKNKGELFLCRDRLGIKPLYYYHKDGKFAYASELSALKLLPDINLEIDPIGLDYYFTYGYIPAPFSAYKYIKKLRPAHILVYDISKKEIRIIEPYWRLSDSIKSHPCLSEQEWIEAIEDKIKEAVNLRLISDVPLGAFLSGGLDSSLIVSMMANLMEQPVKTFTIGFDFQKYDERVYAESISKQYNTEHHVEVANTDAMAVLPRLIQVFGEPFNDPSAIPTYYVARMASRDVKVALSGDGGDEVFTGYTRYNSMYKFAYLNGIPFQIRNIFKYLGKYLPEYLPGYGFLQRVGYNGLSLYQDMMSCFPIHERERLYTEDFKRSLRRDEKPLYQMIIEELDGFEDEIITQLQKIDLHSYLPEDVLTKVDRMSMLHSLETRVPLLDHELVELVFSCPASIRFKTKIPKYIIKKILSRKVSMEVLQHKKHGFGVPLEYWFRNDLKDLMEQQIKETKNDPFINNNYVRQIFDMHQKGGRNFGRRLYTVLFYKHWHALET